MSERIIKVVSKHTDEAGRTTRIEAVLVEKAVEIRQVHEAEGKDVGVAPGRVTVAQLEDVLSIVRGMEASEVEPARLKPRVVVKKKAARKPKGTNGKAGGKGKRKAKTAETAEAAAAG